MKLAFRLGEISDCTDLGNEASLHIAFNSSMFSDHEDVKCSGCDASLARCMHAALQTVAHQRHNPWSYPIPGNKKHLQPARVGNSSTGLALVPAACQAPLVFVGQVGQGVGCAKASGGIGNANIQVSLDGKANVLDETSIGNRQNIKIITL